MSFYSTCDEGASWPERRPDRWFPRLSCWLVFWWLLTGSLAAAGQPVHLRELTEHAGIRFRHTDGSSGNRYIVESVSAGVATLDFDGDGLIDIYFLNGAPLPGSETSETPPRNALYRNVGGFRFVDVTEEAGVGDTGYGLGVAVADFNNNGFPDIYLNNYGPNVFYRNNGDGTFTDVSRATGTVNGHQVGAGANFLDINGNGWLDLFVSNYLEFSYDAVETVTVRGFPIYPGPERFPPAPDVLFRNNGDGTFTDISDEAGIAAHAGHGMGTISGDLTDSGHPDIFVANDSTGNFLFVNDGTGRFQEQGLLAGVAYDGDGDLQGSMGADVADYNNNGLLDLYMTAYQQQLATLYQNLGDGRFDDRSLRTGAGAGTYHRVNWGGGFADFNNNGFRDLFIAHGHIHDTIDHFDTSTSYRLPNQLLLNDGGERFMDVSSESGDVTTNVSSSRGAAFDDLNNNGRIDAVILNSRERPTILRNDTQSAGHWIQVRLRGVQTNRDGVGARVRVQAGDRVQIAEVHSGRGYQSHYGTRLHFGLADHPRVDRIQVRWVGGEEEVFDAVAVDQIVTLQEGHGSPR